MFFCVRACLHACVCAYSARELVFQTVFENVYVSFCLPLLVIVSEFRMFERVRISVGTCVSSKRVSRLGGGWSSPVLRKALASRLEPRAENVPPSEPRAPG